MVAVIKKDFIYAFLRLSDFVSSHIRRRIPKEFSAIATRTPVRNTM